MVDIPAIKPSQTRLEMRNTNTMKLVRVAHRYAGLAALLWLSVLGVTGFILDHHDWRWSHQWTVPEWVTSAPIDRLVRGTIIRHVHVQQSNTANWLGASERGLWITNDRGKTWTEVDYEGESGSAQVYRMVPVADRENQVLLATDDGLWTVKLDGAPATRFALDGKHITSLSPGVDADEVVALSDHKEILRIDAIDGSIIQTIELGDVLVQGLPKTVAFNRFVLELHFGKGLLVQPWSTIINDYGGLAMLILGSTGFLFWWLPKRWRSNNQKSGLKRRQTILRWLFRSHGPVIGLLAIIPILYLSITGIMVDHVQTLIDVGKEIPLKRESLPPIYQYDSLIGEVSHVVAFPDRPEHFAVATRLGVLETSDSGKTWHADQSVPTTIGSDAGNITLLREGNTVFLGVGSIGNAFKQVGGETWTFMDVPGSFPLAMTDAVQVGNGWYLKNSSAIFEGGLESGFERTDITYPPLTGTSWFLFMADIHTGNIIHGKFEWVNDIIAILAIVLVITGPVRWWQRKWM